MAWHSQAWSHAVETKLHPLVALDPKAPTRFASVSLASGAPGTAIVALPSGWERWRVSRISREAERLLAPTLGGSCTIAYLTDELGGALYSHDLLGDLEIIPQRRAASVKLLAVLDGERAAQTVVPSADQERCINALERIDAALAEKAEFMETMDGIYTDYGVPGAGGLLQALDDAIDERDQSLAMIDQITAFLTPQEEERQEPNAAETAARADPRGRGPKKQEDPNTIRPAWNASIKVVEAINPHFDKDLDSTKQG
jgi:hypothetical protein